MFGYRTLGFGAFSAAVAAGALWEATLTLGAAEGKANVFSYGYDTHEMNNGSSIGSLSDNTMASPSATILRLIYFKNTITTSQSSVRIEFDPTLETDTGWTKLIVDGTEYLRTEGTYNGAPNGGTHQGNDWAWYTGTNPMSESSGAEFEVSIE